jgi:ankyrin repeat protein
VGECQEEIMKKAIFIVLISIFAVSIQSAPRQKAQDFLVPILGGDINEVRRLINAGADVNGKFNFGATGDIPPLFLATMLGQTEICKILIDAGADVHVIIQGMTLLHNVALSSGDYKEIAELLIVKGLDVNAKATYREARDATPLHVAAGKGNISIAALLIKNGAEVNARVPYNGLTALHLAARDGSEKMAELLITNGAEINAKSTYEETPFDLAISNEHKELAELLRKHGGVSGKRG